ncbi:hypothetical protein [Nonomuraea insulae]|uniref:Uncharacterized protein n=1 Tax=Nonomuraea insulae TaxID=1616787 RepID=A0ABW1DE76_9ACTN
MLLPAASRWVVNRCGVGGKGFAVVGAQAVEGDAQQPVPHLWAALVGDLDGVAQ